LFKLTYAKTESSTITFASMAANTNLPERSSQRPVRNSNGDPLKSAEEGILYAAFALIKVHLLAPGRLVDEKNQQQSLDVIKEMIVVTSKSTSKRQVDPDSRLFSYSSRTSSIFYSPELQLQL
jgi:hypothetical protein